MKIWPPSFAQKHGVLWKPLRVSTKEWLKPPEGIVLVLIIGKIWNQQALKSNLKQIFKRVQLPLL